MTNTIDDVDVADRVIEDYSARELVRRRFGDGVGTGFYSALEGSIGQERASQLIEKDDGAASAGERMALWWYIDLWRCGVMYGAQAVRRGMLRDVAAVFRRRAGEGRQEEEYSYLLSRWRMEDHLDRVLDWVREFSESDRKSAAAVESGQPPELTLMQRRK